MSPNPQIQDPDSRVVHPADASGPCVTEFGPGGCLGSAGRNGVVLLGAGGSVSGVPGVQGDLESSGIHRFDLSRIRPDDGAGWEIPAGASVFVEPEPA